MSSFSASAPREVTILVYPGVTLLDATGPAQVFAEAAHVVPADDPPYRVVLASRSGGPIATDTGIALGTVSLEEAASRPMDTLLAAGGMGVFAAAEDAQLVDWIRRQATRTRRAGSTCMGAFLTAAAGLLRDRRAVTHWRWCETLQEQHPEAIIERDPIFVQDGPVWSSAGVSAGIDLALAMVAEDHGHNAALGVARRLVVYLKRPGGQAQFSAVLAAQTADRHGDFDLLHAWMSDNLAADLRVDRLAGRVGMSPRNFARRYAARMSATPAHAVEMLRVEAARRLLEDVDIPVKTIAARCGFGDYERLRRSFVRTIGVAPTAYRERFGAASSGVRASANDGIGRPIAAAVDAE
jgi:transcriptional regulator GlxA family with amidase domain